MLKVIIANKLHDGLVVFLTEDGDWSYDIAEAALAHDESQGARLLEQAKAAELANIVIDPYLIDITIQHEEQNDEQNGKRIPTDYREYIRATGPTVPIPA